MTRYPGEAAALARHKGAAVVAGLGAKAHPDTGRGSRGLGACKLFRECFGQCGLRHEPSVSLGEWRPFWRMPQQLRDDSAEDNARRDRTPLGP